MKMLTHPVVGLAKPGDVVHHMHAKCIDAFMLRYPANRTALSALPLRMRLGGSSKASWHRLICETYGFTHLIMGSDYAGLGANSEGNDH